MSNAQPPPGGDGAAVPVPGVKATWGDEAGPSGTREMGSGFAAQMAGYVRQRLRLAVRVLWLVGGAGLVLNVAQRVADDGWRVALLIDPELLMFLGALALLSWTGRLTRSPDVTAVGLERADAVLVLLLEGVCVVSYHFDFNRGGGHGLLFLGMLLVARAVILPSTARRTFLLSVPALVATLAVQLAHAFAGDPLPSGLATQPIAPFSAPWWASVAWSQVYLGSALGLATMASRVTFRLRLEAYEAQRLGPYVLEHKIGAGGMGEVYRARHALMQRPVALKFIRDDAASDAALQRFSKEVEATSRLTHPNTIAVYDYGTTPEGTFYYAMELLDGADLQRILDATGPMPASRVIHILTQALSALAEAHAAGLVHRDIKLGNLILCVRGLEHDVVKVMDFGLVKDAGDTRSDLSQQGQVMGSPETLAPETLRGEPPTGQTDLYALGVVGCQLLTGMAPFDARTPVQFAVAHLMQPPIPPSTRRAGVPADLEAVLMQCLAKQPTDRPASAVAMRAALRTCADAGRWTEADASAWWTQNGVALRPRIPGVPAPAPPHAS